MNGSSARKPRVWPLRAFSAARRTRSSPGSATATGSGAVTGGFVLLAGSVDFGGRASTATLACYLDEHAASEPERDADAPAFDPDFDGAFVLAHCQDLDPRSRHQASALQLTQATRVRVGHALADHLLAGLAFAQGALAVGTHLAAHAGDGVAMGIELGTSEQLEDSLLHPLGHHVLEPFGLVVHLVPAVTEHPDQEHLEQPVVADKLEGDLPALASELLAAVPVVFYEALGGETGDHLAHGG